jgi:MFS family permease
MSLKEPDYEAVWRNSNLGWVGLFYLAQGVAFGALVFLPSYLRYLGLSDFDSILWQSIILLPWYLKIIFGILSDNVPLKSWGRRKPYIFIAAAFGLIGWLSIPFVGGALGFGPLLVVVGLLASTGAAMSDAVIDAMAVDVTPPRRRGSMQGISWGFRGLGLGLAAVGMGLLSFADLWTFVFLIPGVLLAIFTFLTLVIKENPLPPDFSAVPLSTYKDVFSMRKVQICLLFQILAGIAIAIVPILQTLLEEGLGFDLITVGIIFMIFAIGWFLGAIIIGVLGDNVSLRTMLPMATILYIIAVISALIVAPYLLTWTITAGFFFIVGMANGGYEATYMRIGMDNSPSILGGTMMNLYNSLSNIGQLGLGAIIIAFMAIYVFGGNYILGLQITILFFILALTVGWYLIKKPKEEEPVK